jgi:hypothetical protein
VKWTEIKISADEESTDRLLAIMDKIKTGATSGE